MFLQATTVIIRAIDAASADFKAKAKTAACFWSDNEQNFGGDFNAIMIARETQKFTQSGY